MRWQYKQLDILITELAQPSFESRLDALGKDGWELVTGVVHEHPTIPKTVHFVFKRSRTD